MKQFKKTDYCYTALFCEENIWHLAQSLMTKGVNEKNIQVIFLSNKKQQIALFNQLSVAKGHAVIWDYHVILLLKTGQAKYLLDFDSRLPFMSPYEDYLENTFSNDIDPAYQTQFRIIPAKIYLDNFYSDRSHMKGVIAESCFPEQPKILSCSKNKIVLNDLWDSEKEIKNTIIKLDKYLITTVLK